MKSKNKSSKKVTDMAETISLNLKNISFDKMKTAQSSNVSINIPIHGPNYSYDFQKDLIPNLFKDATQNAAEENNRGRLRKRTKSHNQIYLNEY